MNKKRMKGQTNKYNNNLVTMNMYMNLCKMIRKKSNVHNQLVVMVYVIVVSCLGVLQQP